MITNATDMKNNFGQYLKQVMEDDTEVIVTKNNQKVARLVPYITSLEKYFTLKDNTAEYRYDKQTVTYEEFLEISEKSESRMEYLNGEIWIMSSPNVDHQEILGNLHVLFKQYFKGKKCKPFLAPFDVHLKKIDIDVPDVLQPDLLVACDWEDHINEMNKYTGTPSLVLEILSKSTRSRDMVYKLNTYMSAGVKEYWVVDPKSKSIIIYEFENYAIDQFAHYKIGEIAKSFTYEDLEAEVSEYITGVFISD